MNEFNLRRSDKFRFWLIRKIAGHRVLAYNLRIENGGIKHLADDPPAMIWCCTITGAPAGITMDLPSGWPT